MLGPKMKTLELRRQCAEAVREIKREQKQAEAKVVKATPQIKQTMAETRLKKKPRQFPSGSPAAMHDVGPAAAQFYVPPSIE